MPRPEGIATSGLETQCCYDFAAGTNAPTRGDCDLYILLQCAQICIEPERMPRPEGIATRPSVAAICCLSCRNECPDQRGLRLCQDSSTLLVDSCRNECPDQRGLRPGVLAQGADLLVEPERMPRPEGIATIACAAVAVLFILPERMPRPEGIATTHRGPLP